MYDKLRNEYLWNHECTLSWLKEEKLQASNATFRICNESMN